MWFGFEGTRREKGKLKREFSKGLEVGSTHLVAAARWALALEASSAYSHREAAVVAADAWTPLALAANRTNSKDYHLIAIVPDAMVVVVVAQRVDCIDWPGTGSTGASKWGQAAAHTCPIGSAWRHSGSGWTRPVGECSYRWHVPCMYPSQRDKPNAPAEHSAWHPNTPVDSLRDPEWDKLHNPHRCTAAVGRAPTDSSSADCRRYPAEEEAVADVADLAAVVAEIDVA